METVTRISGWVEYRDNMGKWRPALRLEDLGNEGRPYNLFGLLFGVRNYTGFSPVAGVRGIPEDASEYVREVFANGSERHSSPSYLTLSELKGIKFSHLKKKLDHFPHFYREEDGLEVSAQVSLSDFEERALLEGKAVRKGPIIVKREGIRRKDILTKGWLVVAGIMEALATSYSGEENVRAVVWFTESNSSGDGEETGRRRKTAPHSLYPRA